MMMSVGAESRMEKRLKKLEAMIRDPRSAINLESLLVSCHECFMHAKAPFLSVFPVHAEKKTQQQKKKLHCNTVTKDRVICMISV